MKPPFYSPPIVSECCRVPKGWGEEKIIINNEFYCGKLLIFNPNCSFSMHYHLLKDETWYVQEGKFIYTWIDTQTAIRHTETLSPGDVVRQRPGQPHQLLAIDGGIIFEVSTTHYDEDSYRIEKGSSQK